MLLGIRLLGTTFGCRLSNLQAATAQMHLVEKEYRGVPTPLTSTSPCSDDPPAPPSARAFPTASNQSRATPMNIMNMNNHNTSDNTFTNTFSSNINSHSNTNSTISNSSYT